MAARFEILADADAAAVVDAAVVVVDAAVVVDAGANRRIEYQNYLCQKRTN